MESIGAPSVKEIEIEPNPEVKTSIPIKIDRNHQNNHAAANSVHFLSKDQFLS
jgi:hypothetical protein